VQAYADNNPSMRNVTYEQAAGSVAEGTKKGGVKAEKVDNPYGSTAGAGSGEFHVYRHARSREMSRLQQLDEMEIKNKADAEFYAKVKSDQTSEETKTAKRRKKRQREKEAKRRKKIMKQNGLKLQDETDKSQCTVDEEEFEYVPSDHKKLEGEIETDTAVTAAIMKNDGSFLDIMKKKLAAENQTLLEEADVEDAKEQACSKAKNP